MIETIYKSEDNSGKPDINIRLPKNIKQIGQSDSNMNCQIYIEENVLTYIKKKPYRENQIRYGVLLGDKKQGNGYTYIFINGMVEVEEVIEESIIFSDDVWTSIYDNIRRYYSEGIIVGWYASFEHDVTKDMLSIRKIHVDHFAGNNKVFLNINREEDEEAFYIYETNGLNKQPCYHVYFEKSMGFEDYMFGSGRDNGYIKEKQTNARETGKYGIALNNGNNVTNTNGKETGVVKKMVKEGGKMTTGSLGRVASFATILALAGVIGVMGYNGGLDALQGKVSGFIDGILHSDEKKPDMGEIIEVDGNPTEQSVAENAPSEQLTSNTPQESQSSEETSKELTSEELTSEELASEDSSSKELSTKESTSDISTSEDETTTKNKVNVSQEETTEKSHATISDANATYATYTVKDGETLYSISMLFYGTADMIDDIMKINNMTDENYVMEGQKILLP